MKQVLIFLMIIALFAGVGFAGTLEVKLVESVSETSTFNGTAFDDEIQGTPTATGIINVTNTFSERLYDINVTFTDAGSKVGAISGCDSEVTAGADYIHITELDSGDSVTCSYAISALTAADEPLNFTEFYSDYRPLVGENITATVDIVNNNYGQYTITGLTCYKNVTIGGSGAEFNYTTIVNGTGSLSADGRRITWIPVDLTNSTGDQTSYNVTMPNATIVPSAGGPLHKEMGYWACQFTMNASVSGYTVNTVEAAGGNVKIGVVKSQDATTWYSNATLNNTNSFNITVGSVTRWATVEASVVPDAAWISGSYNASGLGTPFAIEAGQSWYSGTHSFTYSDIPVMWMNASFTVQDVATQIQRSYETSNGSYFYIQKVWVINGYKMQVVKEVENLTAAGYFNITITATNTGSGETPDNVFVYDFVPAAFYNSTNGYESPNDISLSPLAKLQNDQDDLYGHYTSHQSTSYGDGGEGFVWQFGSLSVGETITIEYTIWGTGDYNVRDVYVVGVDPIQTVGTAQGSQTLELAEIINMSGNNDMPFILLVVTLGAILVAVNVTRRKK